MCTDFCIPALLRHMIVAPRGHDERVNSKTLSTFRVQHGSGIMFTRLCHRLVKA